jgi:hypothetical protein
MAIIISQTIPIKNFATVLRKILITCIDGLYNVKHLQNYTPCGIFEAEKMGCAPEINEEVFQT